MQKRTVDSVIVEEFDLSHRLEICKMESTPELPKVKLSGALPSLKVYLSPEKLKKLWRVIQAVFPSNPQNLRTVLLGPKSSKLTQSTEDERFCFEKMNFFTLLDENFINSLIY